MTEKEIKAGLRSLDLSHPFAKALFEVLENLEKTARDAVATPGLNNEARQYNAGALGSVMDVALQLHGAIEIARGEHTDTRDEAE